MGITTEVKLNWTNFKAMRTVKDLKIQYKAFSTKYYIWMYDGYNKYTCSIRITTPANTDQTDFENNEQNNANSKSSADRIDESGGNRALRVTSNTINATATTTRFRPKIYASKVDISIASESADTELANINVDGKLDALLVNFTRDDIQFVLLIDTVEILRVNLEDLKDSNEYDLDKHDYEIRFPISISSSGKRIAIKWQTAPDVISNITIKARKTSFNDINMKSILIAYKEKV